MTLHVAPTRTGARYALYAADGRRVRGNYRSAADAEAARPQVEWSIAYRARLDAIDAAIRAGATVDEALAAHPPVGPEPRRRGPATAEEAARLAALTESKRRTRR